MGCSNNNNNTNNANGANNTNGLIREKCCVGQTGCSWDGDLSSLVLEPIYVQKIYDAALFNLQGISYAQGQAFSPAIPVGSTVVGVNFINITKYFDPTGVNCCQNFTIDPETTLQGAQFVQSNSSDVTVVGPDGLYSEKIIYADTSCCDYVGKGTPVFGTQNITLSGYVRIDMEIVYIDPTSGSCPITQLLTGFFEITAPGGQQNNLVLTNFFELCIPSTTDGAFLPRFTELCNASFTGRLMTNNLGRDITVTSNGIVCANILVSICITCEKKIVLPVQLCVLSTGFTQLAPDTSMICSTYPSLFPYQIDEASIARREAANGGAGCPKKPCGGIY